MFTTRGEGGWTVHATSAGIRASVYHQKGRLFTAISAALADFAVQRDILDEQLADLLGLTITEDFTDEELRTIRDQSDREGQPEFNGSFG